MRPSSSPFPLQNPFRRGDGASCIWLVLDSFPEDPRLISHMRWSDWNRSHHHREGNSTMPGEGGTTSFTRRAHGNKSLQHAPGWGSHLALTWQNKSERGFNFDQLRTTSSRTFRSNYIKFIWLHSATVYKHGRKEYSLFVNVSKTFPLSLWEICMHMKHQINLLQSFDIQGLCVYTSADV